MGALVRVDRVEAMTISRIVPLEDASASLGDPVALRERVRRDGFLFLRRLIPRGRVLALRRFILDYARAAGWLDPAAPVEEARGWPGKRIGDYEAGDWIELQARAQMSRELWEVGDCIEIHRAFHAATGRSSFIYNGMNTCRVVSAHSDMVALPHQDAHYVRAQGEFWTVWVPLGDCPLELGPLAALPGSHQDGLRPHSGQGIFQGGVAMPEDTIWHTADFKCGDVLLLTQHTIHRSLPNLSDRRLRLSGDFRYGFWNQ
jgi:hypothetical protein